MQTPVESPLEMRRRYLDDPQRPTYHFLAPANFMGDPNGAVYWKGWYHLFYQYNPLESVHVADSLMHWGHTRSRDLLHWEDLPVAISPEPGKPDSRGCYSGQVVDRDGVPTMFYYGRGGGNCIASSDDDMIVWHKYPKNPVMPHPPKGTAVWGPWDPCAWREGDTWYSLSGGHVDNKDAPFLFKSRDFVNWQYIDLFYEPGEQSDCSVPEFFPMGDKHVLMFASHLMGCQYYVGDWRNEKFHPQVHRHMNYLPTGLEAGNLFAGNSLLDDRGRRILFAWVPEGLNEDAQRRTGWAGTICLPRVLTLAGDNTLLIEPLPQLQQLRGQHLQLTDIHVPPRTTLPLDDVAGDCLELAVQFEPGPADRYGLAVRRSPDASEQTLIYYDPSDRHLCLDADAASLNSDMVGRGVQRGPLELAADEPLRLRIFLDHSIVEVFANGRQCLTKRIYPTGPDSIGIALFTHDTPATVRQLDHWPMGTIWTQL